MDIGELKDYEVVVRYKGIAAELFIVSYRVLSGVHRIEFLNHGEVGADVFDACRLFKVSLCAHRTDDGADANKE